MGEFKFWLFILHILILFGFFTLNNFFMIRKIQKCHFHLNFFLKFLPYFLLTFFFMWPWKIHLFKKRFFHPSPLLFYPFGNHQVVLCLFRSLITFKRKEDFCLSENNPEFWNLKSRRTRINYVNRERKINHICLSKYWVLYALLEGFRTKSIIQS